MTEQISIPVPDRGPTEQPYSWCQAPTLGRFELVPGRKSTAKGSKGLIVGQQLVPACSPCATRLQHNAEQDKPRVSDDYRIR
jgi:hypothetical protein